MKKSLTLVALAVIAMLTAATASHAQTATLYTADSLPELKRKQGYALIGVDSGETESFLVINSFESRGFRARRDDTDMKLLAQPALSVDELMEYIQGLACKSDLRVELAGKDLGFYFMMLPAGIYQVTEVSYPYFNLPFRLDTTREREWRFYVEEGKVNYIGQLKLARERSEDAVDVNLINRLAADYEHITATYSTLLDQFPLTSGIYLRDDFLDYLAAP